MKDTLLQQFKKRFNKAPERLFFCPGRINLIGEHIDYNGGEVMPCAISMGTYLAVSSNDENDFKFRAMEFTESVDLPMQPSYDKEGNDWFYYPLGVVNELLLRGHSLSGLDMLFSGDLPIGAGLSSSASIEVVTAYAFNTICDLRIPPKEMALMAKKVENEFIGVNSGIMDQFSVVVGKAGNAILLNCDTLEYRYIPLHLGDHMLVIIYTNKPRKLVESKYNERFSECHEALSALQQELPVQNLCEIKPDEILQHQHLLKSHTLQMRALHVIFENERVKQAAGALKKDDLVTFGKLMFDSHTSLQDLYEVSGNELDTIVDFCKGFKGCLGARMTGAGFGGCAIALIEKESFDDFKRKIKPYYTEKTGYDPEIFVTGAEEGVREIKF